MFFTHLQAISYKLKLIVVAPAKKLCANYVGKLVKDEGDIDYVPSLFSYSKTKAATTHSRIRRYQRLMQRRTLAPVSMLLVWRLNSNV